jgi:ATP-binding cassette, subfamily F, member 3
MPSRPSRNLCVLRGKTRRSFATRHFASPQPNLHAITAADMLAITDLTYRIAGRTLLDGASALITAGQRVGIVGRNGAGKSTLLDLILGTLHADQGDITLQKGMRIGFVAQEAPGGEATPLEMVLAADTERAALLHEAETATDGHRIAEIQTRLLEIDAHSAPARAATILAGLGFDEAMQNRKLASFSGGWRMRVALAGVLFSEPDLLLLDEPTNHLDLEASLWLENYLKAWRNTLLLVSHDRVILNGVATHILHLENQKLTLYPGSYDTFVRVRRERLARLGAEAAKQAAQRQKLQAFIDRFRAKATKARQAQSRIKALARLEPIATPAEDSSMSFVFPQPEELRPPLLAFENVSVGYEPGKPILRGINLRLDPDDRIALLGANGNGKSTLAKLISGQLAPLSGEVQRAGKLRCGFFAQHQIEELEAERTPLQHMAELLPRATEQEVRSRLGRFGFSQDKAEVKVKDLSGGERARLNLALVTIDAPPLLVLDEPTNHLDIAAREALVQALNDYNGAVVLISHDWHLLELAADRLLLVSGGMVKPFDGDLEDYRRQLSSDRNTAANSRSEKPEANSRQAERRDAAKRRQDLAPLRKKAAEAAKRVDQLTRDKQEAERVLADPAIYGNGSDVTALLRRQAELVQALSDAEELWLAAEEAVESAAAMAG